jgi:hypothetical protein
MNTRPIQAIEEFSTLIEHIIIVYLGVRRFPAVEGLYKLWLKLDFLARVSHRVT